MELIAILAGFVMLCCLLFVFFCQGPKAPTQQYDQPSGYVSDKDVGNYADRTARRSGRRMGMMTREEYDAMQEGRWQD